MDPSIKLGPIYEDDDCEENCDDDPSGDPKAGGMEEAGADPIDARQ